MKLSWQERLAPLARIKLAAKERPKLYTPEELLAALDPLRQDPSLQVSRKRRPPAIAGRLTKEYMRDAKRSQRLRQYKITKEDFDGLWADQHGQCAICLTPFTKTAHVDHDHKTGIVRGLLCNTCNTGIGLLKDDQEIILNAANYLARHNSLVRRMLEEMFNK